jgi:hypothetical protein
MESLIATIPVGRLGSVTGACWDVNGGLYLR